MENEEKFLATALVTIDRTIGGYATWEIARGPLTSGERGAGSGKDETLLDLIIADAKNERCLALYLSPPTPLSTFHFPLSASSRHVQPQATRIIDLTKSEAEILAQMHPKGRYNISLAKKRGIKVTAGSENDIPAFYDLLRNTGHRDGFKISKQSHYARFLSDLDQSFILMAMHQGKPVAGLLGTEWNGTAIYYYGASSYEHRSLMAPYLLQWEAIRRAKAHGCARYDLLGISPDKAMANDPWFGISDFKRKFGGTVVPYPPEQMIVLKPLIHTALAWKRALMG